MKRLRVKILFGILLIIIVAVGLQKWLNHSLGASVEKTRRELRAQGFKTDFSDFDFSLPAEMSARANAITLAGQSVQSLRRGNELGPMEIIGTNVAVAMSPIEIVETYFVTNLWPLVKEELSAHDRELDAVCATLLAGPVKFRPTVGPDGNVLLPFLASRKPLANALMTRAVLAMHEHDTNNVFTNLLALSKMVTALLPEPSEISHMVRFSCEGIAQQGLWELMQTDCPTDEQLATLQREWDGVRFFDNLPETAELACAEATRQCQSMRENGYGEFIGAWRMIFSDVFSSPTSSFQTLWWAIRAYTQHAGYRNWGSYEDEKASMLFYRDRHEELKRAIGCSTWAEMQLLPGVTNVTTFRGGASSLIAVKWNLRRMGQGRILLGRAAEAEARRRLIVTALALERFAVQHKSYPQSLSELVPAFLPAVPVDFMDGRELRYKLVENGRYVLYSVGLDCVDNGGTIPSPRLLRNRSAEARRGSRMAGDLVWPRPATQEDMDAFEKTQQEREGGFRGTDEDTPPVSRGHGEVKTGPSDDP